MEVLKRQSLHARLGFIGKEHVIVNQLLTKIHDYLQRYEKNEGLRVNGKRGSEMIEKIEKAALAKNGSAAF
jgi:hypothetical protein